MSKRPLLHITTTSGLRGYFAVMMIYVDEDDDGKKLPDGAGYWDVQQSGIGSYKTHDGAVREALDWAQAEGLEYRP